MDENFNSFENDLQPHQFVVDEPGEIVISPEEDFNIQQPITQNEIAPLSNKGSKKGLVVFCIILGMAFALAVACTVGYFSGIKTAKPQSNNSQMFNLESKPEDNKTYSTSEIYENVNKSIVGIVVYNQTGVQGYASGIVYSEDGYIITNDHIYENVPNAKFKIYDYNGKTYDAKFIAGDTRSDLSLIKATASGFYPASFGDSSQLVCGEQVLAIGRPNDATEPASVTSGVVSFVNRRVANSSNYSSKLIQTDAAINPGSSGGALVNMYGQVVGVTSSKIVSSDYEGVGYAIPSTTVKTVVESLLKNGKVTNRAKIGLTYTEINSTTAQIKGESAGLLIAEVSQESDLYGKIKANDIITHVNGTAITKDDILLDVIESSAPNTEITLTVNSSSNKFDIKCKLIADQGGSSYKTDSAQLTPDNDDNDDKNNGGTFDFPFGY